MDEKSTQEALLNLQINVQQYILSNNTKGDCFELVAQMGNTGCFSCQKVNFSLHIYIL